MRLIMIDKVVRNQRHEYSRKRPLNRNHLGHKKAPPMLQSVSISGYMWMQISSISILTEAGREHYGNTQKLGQATTFISTEPP